MRAVFALASGRSGTRFLAGLLRENARGCVVRHEPYLDPGNPTLFGRPLWDRAAGDVARVRQLAERKARRIRRYAPRAYAETSHAFLKTWWEMAPELFDDLRVVHMIRNPLRVARSEANREAFVRRWRLPGRTYRGGDGRSYFRWSLTGLEPVFAELGPVPPGSFEHYVAQWIEIENRAMDFLARFGSAVPSVTLHVPEDLEDPERIAHLLKGLGLEPRHARPVIHGRRHRTPGHPTVVGADEEARFRRVVEALPGSRLAIFRSEPYTRSSWSALLRV